MAEIGARSGHIKERHIEFLSHDPLALYYVLEAPLKAGGTVSMQGNGLLGLSLSISLALIVCMPSASPTLVVSPLTAVTTIEKMAGATAIGVQATGTALNPSVL